MSTPDNTDNKNEENERKACTFTKGNRRGNFRKRKQDDFAVEDESGLSVAVKKKEDSGLFKVSTKDAKKKVEDLSYQSNKTAVPANAGALATATLETETERDKDATAIRHRSKDLQDQILNGEEAEKVYRGLSGYTDYIEKREQSGLAKGTGIRAGPIRASLYARTITRYDYQPDLCKDYKETGYCGFGDSCKFMHDRGDYKNSVELEKEWDAEQKAKKAAAALAEQDGDAPPRDESLDNVPFACPICRKPFVDPVKTKCGHIYCENCALKQFKKDLKCLICMENTFGTFSTVPADMRKKLQKAAELYYKPEEEQEEDVS